MGRQDARSALSASVWARVRQERQFPVRAGRLPAIVHVPDTPEVERLQTVVEADPQGVPSNRRVPWNLTVDSGHEWSGPPWQLSHVSIRLASRIRTARAIPASSGGEKLLTVRVGAVIQAGPLPMSGGRESAALRGNPVTPLRG